MASLWTSSLLSSEAFRTYWDAQTLISGSTKTYLAPSAVRGSMMTAVFSRTPPATLREDVAEYSVHWAIDAGPGAPAVALTGSQASSVETIWDTWWTSVRPYIQPTWILKEYQWRDFGCDMPMGSSKIGQPALKYSPTWRITSKVVPGTSGVGQELPNQVASTVTLSTCSRLHWGRFYIGGMASGDLGNNGRWTTSFVDATASATRTAFNSAAGLPAITNPWVWSSRHGGLLSIREVHADDVPDVIRRRRGKQVGYRKAFTS